MAKHKVSKRYLILMIIMVVWAVMYYVGHSDYMSSYLKNIILEKARSVTDQRITIEEIHINPIPLFLELNTLSAEDPHGELWLETDRVKVYVDFFELFREKMDIRRILVQGADATLDRNRVSMIGALAGKGAGEDRIIIRTVDIRKSDITYEDRDVKMKASGVYLSALIKASPEVNLTIARLEYISDKLSVSDIGVKGKFQLDNDVITIESMIIDSAGSSLSTKGMIYTDSREFISQFRTDIDILDISKVLNLGLSRGGRLNASGKIEYIDGNLSAGTNVSGVFYLESLMKFFELEVPLRGRTEFQGDVRIESNAIYGNARAKMVNGHIYGIDIDSVSCDVVYDPDDGRLYFRNGDVSLWGGTAEADVYITLPRVHQFGINVKADNVNTENVLQLINFNVDVSAGKVTGEVISEGKVFQPHGWFDASFEPSAGNILKRIKLARGKFDSEGSMISLEGLHLETAESNITVDGSVYMKEKKLTLSGYAYTDNISDFTSPYYEEIHGKGYSLFSVKGPLDSPTIRGEIQASRVSYFGISYDRVETSFSYAKELLVIHNLIASGDNERHTLNGRIMFPDAQDIFQFVNPEFDLIAEIKNLKAETVVQKLKLPFKMNGLVTSAISLQGPMEDLRATADVLVSPISLYNVHLGSLKSEASFEGGTFRFKNLIISHRDSVISGDLSIDLDGNYQFKTSRVRIQLRHLPFDLNLEKGVINIEVSGKGSIKDPFIRSQLSISDVIAEGVPVGAGDIEIVLKDRKVTARGKLFEGKTSVEAALNLFDDYQWSVEVEFAKGVYDFILAYILKDIPEDLMLNLDGGLKLSGNKYAYSGLLTMKNFNLNMYGYSFSNASEILIGVDRNRVLMEDVKMVSGNATFTLEGSLIPGGALNLTIHGDSSLAALKSIVDAIDSIKGFGSFVVSITGDWNDPIVNGGITIKKSSIGIAGFDYRIVDLSSYIYIDNNRIVIDSLSGHIGGGMIDVKGYGLLKSLKIQSFYLDTGLKGATFRITRGVVVNGDGQLIVRGEAESSKIVGQVMVNWARFTRRIVWKTQIMKDKGIKRPRGTLSRFEKVELNISIKGSRDITIDNNIAKTELRVELLLGGTVAHPSLFGRIETDKGVFFFRNNDFEVIRASADFIDPEQINPYLDITAATTVKGYDIMVAIEGQIPNLNLSLVSDPPLDETDIFGLITVGEIGSNLEGLEAGIGTAEATSFLAGEYQSVIEERLTLLTGLDRFQVEPYVAEKTGQIGPRITVSKGLIEDKLFVTYSSSVGYSESDVVKLEYQLNKKVSLIGSQDERGALGGDINFRFEFK